MMKLPMDVKGLPSPCYIIDEQLLEQNLQLLAKVQSDTGCRILLAQKGYSAFSTYPMVGKYLAGVTSSSLFEARLGFEEMGKEVHIYAPAYREDEFDEILRYCGHIVFNSVSQYVKFAPKVRAARAAGHTVSCGIRVNPEYSEIETDIYNPCFANSRMGTTLSQFEKALEQHPEVLQEIDGLHFHTMCEQGSEVLARTLPVVEQRFGKYLKGMKWLNFGGGHHITRPGYDVALLERCIVQMQQRYGVQVYLEPGEAVALNAGYLLTTVLDVLENGMRLAILDTSAACHMPDVLEMPYRPNIIGAGQPGEFPYTYRFGGPTCLAGDIIGDYSFPEPLKPGDQLMLCDMAIYSMVKNNTFNGVNLPAIALYHPDKGARVIRTFGYQDFKGRLS